MSKFRGTDKLLVLGAAVFLAVALYLGAAHLATGSDAQAQAPYPGPCDVNEDSFETIQDALLIAQHVVGLTTLPAPIVSGPADCDGSGAVTISDGLLVAQKVVGLA